MAPPRRVVVNLTTSITTSSPHNGIIVHSGIHSPAGSWKNGFGVPNGNSMYQMEAPGQLAISRPASRPGSRAPSRPASSLADHRHVIDDYERRSPVNPPRRVPSPVYSFSGRESPPDEWIEPEKVTLNVFSTGPTEIRRLSPGRHPSRSPPQRRRHESIGGPVGQVMNRGEGVLNDQLTTTTTVEVFRTPIDPSSGDQVVLPPGPGVDPRRQLVRVDGPDYERWTGQRTETLINDPAIVSGPTRDADRRVEWKEGLVDRRSPAYDGRRTPVQTAHEDRRPPTWATQEDKRPPTRTTHEDRRTPIMGTSGFDRSPSRVVYQDDQLVLQGPSSSGQLPRQSYEAPFSRTTTSYRPVEEDEVQETVEEVEYIMPSRNRELEDQRRRDRDRERDREKDRDYRDRHRHHDDLHRHKRRDDYRSDRRRESDSDDRQRRRAVSGHRPRHRHETQRERRRRRSHSPSSSDAVDSFHLKNEDELLLSPLAESEDSLISALSTANDKTLCDSLERKPAVPLTQQYVQRILDERSSDVPNGVRASGFHHIPIKVGRETVFGVCDENEIKLPEPSDSYNFPVSRQKMADRLSKDKDISISSNPPQPITILPKPHPRRPRRSMEYTDSSSSELSSTPTDVPPPVPRYGPFSPRSPLPGQMGKGPTSRESRPERIEHIYDNPTLWGKQTKMHSDVCRVGRPSFLPLPVNSQVQNPILPTDPDEPIVLDDNLNVFNLKDKEEMTFNTKGIPLHASLASLADDSQKVEPAYGNLETGDVIDISSKVLRRPLYGEEAENQSELDQPDTAREREGFHEWSAPVAESESLEETPRGNDEVIVHHFVEIPSTLTKKEDERYLKRESNEWFELAPTNDHPSREDISNKENKGTSLSGGASRVKVTAHSSFAPSPQGVVVLERGKTVGFREENNIIIELEKESDQSTDESREGAEKPDVAGQSMKMFVSEVDIDSSDVSSSSSDGDVTLKEDVVEEPTIKPPPMITTFSPYELQRSRKVDYSAYPKVTRSTSLMQIPEDREIPAGREQREEGIRLVGALSLNQISAPFMDEGSSSSEDDKQDHPLRADHPSGHSDVGGLFKYPGAGDGILESLSRPPAPGSKYHREGRDDAGDRPTFLQKSESSPAVPSMVTPTVVSDSHKLIISGFEV